jgi:hypothetical protein
VEIRWGQVGFIESIEFVEFIESGDWRLEALETRDTVEIQ